MGNAQYVIGDTSRKRLGTTGLGDKSGSKEQALGPSPPQQTTSSQVWLPSNLKQPTPEVAATEPPAPRDSQQVSSQIGISRLALAQMNLSALYHWRLDLPA